MKKIIRVVLLVLVLVTGILIGTHSRGQENKNPPAVPDTVFTDISQEEQARMDRERTGKRTLGEKLTGVEVIEPDAGEGPVVVYNEKYRADTAIARWQLKGNKLSTRLSTPDDSGYVRYLDLPVKNVGHCQSIVQAANGLVLCDKPALGVLNAFTDLGIGYGLDGQLEVDSRVGVGWKRFKNAHTEILVYVKPTDLASSPGPRAYLGVKYQFNVFGN